MSLAWALPLLVVMQARSAGVSPRPVAWAAQSPRPAACSDEPGLWQVSRQRSGAIGRRCRQLARAQALLLQAPGQALERARALLAEAPGFAEARVLRGRASLRVGDTRVALEDLAPLLASETASAADPSALLDGGRAAVAERDTARAARFYRALGSRAALLSDRKQQTLAYIEIAGALLSTEAPPLDDVLAYLREARRRSSGSGFTGLCAALTAVAWVAQGREAEALGALGELTDLDGLTRLEAQQDVWLSADVLHAALGLALERERPDLSAEHYRALAQGPLRNTALGKLAGRSRSNRPPPKADPG